MGKSIADVIPTQFDLPGQRSPVEVLRELASVLTERTQRKIDFRVNSTSFGNEFVHGLIARVRHLNYRAEILRVSNSQTLYPAKVSGALVGTGDTESGIVVTSEEELVDAMGEIFRSGKINQVITALISQLK